MMLRFSVHSLFVPILFFIMFSTLSMTSFSFATIIQENLPENSISITFDIPQSTITGTSKIILPSSTPLKLFCGNLEITGTVLEVEGKSPLTLKTTEQNIIIIPESSYEQTIYVSWKLIATGMNDNLISDKGVTLAGLWHPLPDIDMAYRLEAKLPEDFTAIS